MNLSIIGSGQAAQTLGKALLKLGHNVTLGTRTPTSDAAKAWQALGASAKSATFADAARSADLVVFAPKGEVAEDVAKSIAADLAGKTVIDMTNPLVFGATGPELFVGGTDSLAERIQRAAPAARIVKALNYYALATITAAPFQTPQADLFVAGNEAEAKAKAADLIRTLGWDVVDLGDLRGARYLEALAMITITYAIANNNWGVAFKMLGR